ncbi:hypothetical protein [Xenorhabdus sp. KK7.4]|uniref:hypothetical protein n=1 Tax=Xenorhabdus sp. KK7.4 TaxID=1851572 RepID=UPI00187C33BE|nr:hypothetical protein [Xenorhabdus sp. KK7.4]
MAKFYSRMQKTSERLLKQYGAEFVVKRKGRRWVDDEGRERNGAYCDYYLGWFTLIA